MHYENGFTLSGVLKPDFSGPIQDIFRTPETVLRSNTDESIRLLKYFQDSCLGGLNCHFRLRKMTILKSKHAVSGCLKSIPDESIRILRNFQDSFSGLEFRTASPESGQSES
jgi:hypothetical protein